jgi:hypothetical protein
VVRRVATRIIHEARGINYVVCDITSAAIEWEQGNCNDRRSGLRSPPENCA